MKSPCDHCDKNESCSRTCSLWTEWMNYVWPKITERLLYDTAVEQGAPGADLWEFYQRSRHVVGPINKDKKQYALCVGQER